MWPSHWNLAFDPFLGPASPYVATPEHDEAVARLVDAVETGQRLACLRAGEGLGKSVVLSRALAEVRGPRRRVARVASPVDGTSLYVAMTEQLGSKAPLSRGAAWKALTDAVRLAHWQRQDVVLAVDDAQSLDDPADRRDLERLTHLGLGSRNRLSVIVVGREPGADETNPISSWLLAIRLPPLTASGTGDYVARKLAAAGRAEPAFTPRAIGRIYDLSGGVPRGVDRLASLGLAAGAARGLGLLTAEVVDGVAVECALPAA